MKISIKIVLEDPTKSTPDPLTAEIFSFERVQEGDKLGPENLSLTLTEAKSILTGIQKKLVGEQVEQALAQQRSCPECGRAYQRKGRHYITFSTLFGKLKLDSPRFYQCECQAHTSQAAQLNQTKPQKRPSFSPLSALIPEHSAPEFVYLQTKWAALMSYGLTSQFMAEVLPLDKPLCPSVIAKQVQKVAVCADSELGEERAIFIEGCEAEWEALPPPPPPLTVGVDGGYVRGREGKNRKFGNFEVIVGKSMPSEGQGPPKRFGYVSCYDTKPKRRLFDLLKSQEMQFNQQVTFLSDGGDTVRDLQLYLNPQGEYLLEWFHIAMKFTVLAQLVKGLPNSPKPSEAKPKANGKKAVEEYAEDEEVALSVEKITEELERVKWYLWHGNDYNALQKLEELEFDLEPGEASNGAFTKFYQKLQEFKGYITRAYFSGGHA